VTADLTFNSVATPSASGDLRRRRRALIAAVIGNTLEWYDFVVYAYLAGTLAPLFFSSASETASLLAALATFGVGFVMRPIGGILLGSYADRVGRKKALLLTILLMGFGTATIAFAPTYDSVGWYAPLLIVIARLMQGFSAGGELGVSTAFMIEHSHNSGRGLSASWQTSSQAATLLLGSLVGAATVGLLPKESLVSWGWRIPFALGLLIVPIGLYIRRQIEESPEFSQLANTTQPRPLRHLLRCHLRQLVVGFGLVIVWTVCTYFFLVYMPTYALRELKLPQSSSLLANCAALAVYMVLAPVFGALSDRIGRKPLLLIGAGAILVSSYPLIAYLSSSPSVEALIRVQVVIAIMIAAFLGPAPSALAELFPTSIRSTGMSIAYNGAVATFGGFAPFLATWLIAVTGNSLSPAYYVAAAALLSFLALLFMKETAFDHTHTSS
jgi:MFS transporter, MHS family, proline/betaine transporter